MNKGNIPEEKKHTEDEGNIEQIRELLFGKNIKSLEKRLISLEDQMNEQISLMREENNRLFSSLENYVKKQIDSLVEQFNLEKNKQAENHDKNKEKISQVSDQLSDFNEKFIHFQRDTNNQLLETNNHLEQNILKAKEELTKLIKNKSDSLDERKTDSSKLASLLSDLAIKLDSKEE